MSRTRRGANAVEFALTIPFFVMFLFGTLHAGFLFFYWAMGSEAARRGCAEGAEIAEATGDPQLVAQQSMTAFLSTAGLDCAQLVCRAELRGVTPNRELFCEVSGQPPSPALMGLDTLAFQSSLTRRLSKQ
ncbi:MAG: TadE family protein [Myxococcota bacterium]